MAAKIIMVTSSAIDVEIALFLPAALRVTCDFDVAAGVLEILLRPDKKDTATDEA